MTNSNTAKSPNQDDDCEAILALSVGEDFAAAFQTFSQACRLAGRSAKTISFYDQQVLPFLKWCFVRGVTSLADITRADIRKYLADRSNGRSRATVRAAHRAIRRFMNFSLDEGTLAVSPMSNIAAPKSERRILPAIDEDDLPKLLNGSPCARDTAIVYALLSTGLRASELIRLRGSDVDIDKGRIRVRQGKGGKDRFAYLSEEAKQALMMYYQQRETPSADEQIWLSETTGGPLTQEGLYQMLKRLGRRTEVSPCNPHAFRRTFAVQCLRNGMPESILATLMGHYDPSMLRQYLPFVDDDLMQVHQKYGPSIVSYEAPAYRRNR